MADPKHYTAAAAAIKFNGVKLASITGLNWDETVTRRAIREIGEVHTTERPVVAVDVSLSAAFVRLKTLDERQTGMIGSREVLDVIKEEPVLVEVYEKAGGRTLYTFIDAGYSGGSWSMPSGDVLTGTCRFEAKQLKLESEK